MEHFMDASPILREWRDGGHENAVELADMLGVPAEAYESDPISLVPALQGYVDRLPLTEFEQSDWVTLQADLTSYLADVLVRRHGASWVIDIAPGNPREHRYVIEAEGLDGAVRRVDPADVISIEMKEQPITIIRMLANAEYTLKLTPPIA
ncbi:hypothetical protein [Streptomyces sp. NPDC029003]|uniref:hypothetical protein n=1 Tax=Streptomyces sp. NPDC029003 TaxID=3155125 RepID=UPI0033C5FEFF